MKKILSLIFLFVCILAFNNSKAFAVVRWDNLTQDQRESYIQAVEETSQILEADVEISEDDIINFFGSEYIRDPDYKHHRLGVDPQKKFKVSLVYDKPLAPFDTQTKVLLGYYLEGPNNYSLYYNKTGYLVSIMRSTRSKNIQLKVVYSKFLKFKYSIFSDTSYFFIYDNSKYTIKSGAEYFNERGGRAPKPVGVVI